MGAGIRVVQWARGRAREGGCRRDDACGRAHNDAVLVRASVNTWSMVREDNVVRFGPGACVWAQDRAGEEELPRPATCCKVPADFYCQQ